MKKKIILIPALIIMLAFITMLASGCQSKTVQSEQTSILCAGFAEYDWVRNIIGENPSEFEISLLNDSGVDMHSYQPSVDDMIKIANCQIIVYTGGDSQFWIKDAIVSSPSAERQEVSLVEIFSHNNEISSRYSIDSDDDEDEHEHEHHQDHDHEIDEHLWLSLKLAPTFIRELAAHIGEMDLPNAKYYEENAEKYIDSITSLDEQYELAVSNASYAEILFADRYPFKYMLEDYGLSHIAAFSGCSAETEASFETILALSEELNHLNLSSVAILKKSQPNLAQTIINNSGMENVRILVFDSMQSVTASEIEAGKTYISTMEENLESLKHAIVTNY